MSQLNRRVFLGRSMAGALASVPVLAPQSSFASQPGAAIPSSAAPLRAFYESLTVEQRRQMCFAWDHRGFTKLPLRLHVTNYWNVSPVSITSFTKDQQQLIENVIASVLSPGWPEKLKRQARDDTRQTWGNQKVAIFGAPDKGPCQMVVTGFHLTLRATCEATPAVAFHGAICHGHQPSGFNERVGRVIEESPRCWPRPS